MIQSPKMEISLKNTVVSCCHPALNQTSTYRSVNKRSASTDEAEAFKKKKGGAVIGLLLPGSNPIHSPLCLRHGREILSKIYCLPAAFLPHISHRCFPWRSTSMPRASSDRLPVIHSQLCEEAPHFSEGGSVAAQLPHLINSFSTAPWRLAVSLWGAAV